MNDNQTFTISPSLPILLQTPSQASKMPTERISQISDLHLQLSSPRGIVSLDIRRANSDKLLQVTQNKKGFGSPLSKKSNNILFTIQENYLSRKNHQLMSPRPPKYKPATAKAIPLQEVEVVQKSRERKVVFTDKLVHETRKSPSVRHESPVTRPIIRNNTKGSDHGDNLSNSSRSLSAQNSFVSQFRHFPRKPQVRHDANHQKFAQILSHFQRNKQQRSRNKLSRHFRQKVLEKQQKYTDSIFPPVFTSLFINPTRMPSQAKLIQWKRISQLYGNNSVLLSPDGQSHVRIVRGDGSLAEQFLAIAFNAVKHSVGTLERIFEGQKYNPYGLYLIRIFQQHHWRSLIIDDFIPVRIISEPQEAVSIHPAFLSVTVQQNHPIELWPHLLEKAFSHYYSAFGLLRFGNTVDFVSQLMGLSPTEMIFKKKTEKQFIGLQSCLESVDSFALGEMGQQNQSVILWIRYQGQTSSVHYCHSPTFIGHPLTIDLFTKLSGTIFLFSPKVYHSLSTSSIGRYSPHHSGQQRSQYSIRRLTLSQTSDILITLQQKEARFFAQSSLNYNYMWVRVVLVQRQYNGYRWIEGKYGCKKNLILQACLTAGQYYLVVMTEWKQTQNFEISLLVWANHHVGIQREKGSCEQMIQQACMDLAQRKGKINQLSPTLCSYNYICPRTALVIQNINNQKLKESAIVKRNISGLPCSVPLLPLNKIFWNQGGKILGEVEIAIPKLSSFTIVLKMRGGTDEKLIKYFSEQEGKANK